MIAELDALRPLLKYFEVLIDEYPNPISQTELAEKSSVTKSAVSKIRDELKLFCNIRALAFQRKLLLKSDSETFWRVFGLFFLESNFRKFIRSNYTRHLIEKMKIHEKLIEAKDLDYGRFFEKEDTNLIIQIILANIVSYPIDKDIQHQFRVLLKMNEEGSIIQVFPIVQIFWNIVSNFNVGVFESEDELLKILRLRDKFYAFIKYIAGKMLNEWVVVKRIEDPKKKANYLEVYLEAVDFFLTSLLAQVTENIRKVAKEKKMPFDNGYNEIGKLYSVYESGEIVKVA